MIPRAQEVVPNQPAEPPLQRVDPGVLAGRALAAGLAHVRTIAMSALFPDAVIHRAEEMYADLHHSGALDGEFGNVSLRVIVNAVLWAASHERWDERPEDVRRITDYCNRRRAR